MIRAALLSTLTRQGASLLEASLRGKAEKSISVLDFNETIGEVDFEAVEECNDYASSITMSEREGFNAAYVSNASELGALGSSLRYHCLGESWKRQKCQNLAQELRDMSWPHLVQETEGVQVFNQLPRMAPAIKLFTGGGGIGVDVKKCRKDGKPVHLFYRHIYKAGGLAIKKNLATDAGMWWGRAVDADWARNDRCSHYREFKGWAIKPVLFTFVRDPVEKFIAGYREISSRGLINRFRNARVGTVEHALRFMDNVFHGSCDNGHVLLQVQNLFGGDCTSKFDYIGKLERFTEDWRGISEQAGCDTEKGLEWPFNLTHLTATQDFGAEQAMRKALAQHDGRMMRALCFWVLPDLIVFGYKLPPACQDHEVLLQAAAVALNP